MDLHSRYSVGSHTGSHADKHTELHTLTNKQASKQADKQHAAYPQSFYRGSAQLVQRRIDVGELQAAPIVDHAEVRAGGQPCGVAAAATVIATVTAYVVAATAATTAATAAPATVTVNICCCGGGGGGGGGVHRSILVSVHGAWVDVSFHGG